MAGLLATRVLADYFEHVTLLERDTLARSRSRARACRRGAMSMSCFCAAD